MVKTGFFVFWGVMLILCFAGCGTQDAGVRIMGVWGGSELDVFNEIILKFEQKEETRIQFEATRDIIALLTSRVEAGNPPDIAILPQLSLVSSLAREGRLVDLRTVMDMDTLEKEYSSTWIDLGSVDGTFYGLFFKTAVKGLVYYNPGALKAAGGEVPENWEQMMTVSRKLAESGTAPWAVGIESGDATGWPATDWIENIFVRLYGAEKYVDWYEGKLPWTSPEVKQAWSLFGDIACDEKMVYGGPQTVLSTNFQTAGDPVFRTPPKAFFFQQASFMAGMLKNNFPSLEPIKDINFFSLPPINPVYSAVEIGGDCLVVFNASPGVKAFLSYLASTEAQSLFAGTGATMPNKMVPLEAYTSEADKAFAEILKSADTVVFDASDMMPSQVNAAFWSGTVSFIENPSSLDEVLEEIEKVRQDTYK